MFGFRGFKRISWIILLSCGLYSSAYGQAYNERIEQQELELRRLVGDVENLKYENMRLKKDLDSLKSQIDIRFEMLEGEKPQATTENNTQINVESDNKAGTLSASGTVGAGNPTSKSQNLYDTAKMDFDKRQYDVATTGFEQFIKDYPNDALTPNAYYWLGESYYARQNYNKAALMFLEGKRKFPQSQKAGHSLYKLGMSLQALGENKEACLTFDEVQKVYLPKDATLNALLAKGRQTAKCP